MKTERTKREEDPRDQDRSKANPNKEKPRIKDQ